MVNLQGFAVEVMGDELFDGALGVVVSVLLKTIGEGLNEWQHGYL